MLAHAARSGTAARGRSASIPGRVSVVIPTYNRSEMVTDTLDSMARQSWQDIEIIVVDDGSTDDTPARLEQWRSAHPSTPLKVISQANGGAGSARNRGLAEAKGEYVYFIDSDDLAAPDALTVLARGAARTGAPYVVAHIRNCDLAGKPVAGDSEGIAVVGDGDYFGSRWMTHGALYRREVLDRAGPFDVQLRRGEDTEHIWRVIATHGAGLLVPNYVGLRRIHDRGHLSVGRSWEAAARDDLLTVSRFIAWARFNHRLDARIARSALRRSLLTAIRSGFSRDWATNRQSLALAGEMARLHRPSLATLCLLMNWRSALLYTPLMVGLESLKWLRDRLWFAGWWIRSWQRPAPPQLELEASRALPPREAFRA